MRDLESRNRELEKAFHWVSDERDKYHQQAKDLEAKVKGLEEKMRAQVMLHLKEKAQLQQQLKSMEMAV